MVKEPNRQTPKTEIWKHNGFIGSATMMQKQCQAIFNSRTATDSSKELATKIYNIAKQLEISLRAGRAI